jgi:hypothetical protein
MTDVDLLPPSVLVAHKRFYIHELAELDDGCWIVPQMWIENAKGQLCVDYFAVEQTNDVCLSPYQSCFTYVFDRIPCMSVRIPSFVFK